MEGNLIYIYCITDTPYRPSDALKSEGVECVGSEDFFAVVKLVSPADFSEENLKKNFSDLNWIEIHARDHIRIISEVMESNSVIPFKFGTIFNSEESLGNFIQDYSASLADNLKNTKDKEEWAVKVYCDRGTLNLQIGEISEEVRNLETEISKSMPGKAFLLKRKRVELIDLEVEKVIRNCGQNVFEELVVFSEFTKINNILPKEVTERTDDMILNISCFVRKDRVEELKNAVGISRQKYQHVGFKIDATGPWPPFSFISIKEK